MELIINGNTEKVELSENSVLDLLEAKEVKMPQSVSVEINGVKGAKEAKEAVLKSVDLYKEKFGK